MYRLQALRIPLAGTAAEIRQPQDQDREQTRGGYQVIELQFEVDN